MASQQGIVTTCITALHLLQRLQQSSISSVAQPLAKEMPRLRIHLHVVSFLIWPRRQAQDRVAMHLRSTRIYP